MTRMIENFNSKRQVELGLMLEGAFAGDRTDTKNLFEAMTTSDEPTLLQPAINRRVREVYDSYEPTWSAVAGRETVDDFRLQEIVRPQMTDGTILESNSGKAFVAGGLPKISELGEYPTIGMTATNLTYKIGKSGVKASLSWEEIINGRSIGILEKFIQDFARRSRKQEDFEAYTQFLTASGFSANVTGASNDSTLAGNPALSMTALKAAYAQAVTHVRDGQRVPLGGQFQLVVPRALEITAREILAVTEIRDTSVTNIETISGNPISGLFNLVVADAVTAINSGADAYWWIQPAPNAVEDANASVAFLRGHEAPEVFVKSTTLQNPEDGDFDHDAYETKVRHTATGVFKEAIGIVASTGAGA